MQLAPILLYLVYDGFETDLDAALVLERVMGAADTALAMFDHVKHFLRACLSTHNSADNKPYVIGTEFSMAPSMASRRWAKTKFVSCFPTLTSAVTTTAAGSTLPQVQALLDIIAAIRSTGAPSSTAPTPSPPTMEEKGDSKGVFKNELAVTLQMCSQASTGAVTDLPSWIQALQQKEQVSNKSS